MLALSWALATLAASAAQTAPEKAFVEAFQRHKAAVIAAPTPARRAAELAGLRSFLERSFREARGSDAAARTRLKMTIASLQSYIGEIDPRRLDAPGCVATRDRIRLSADPRGESETELPGEAREALSLLDSLCRR